MRGRRWVVVTLIVMSALLAADTAADSARFVRVHADTANIRERPTTRADPVWQAYENDPLQVLGRRGAWLQVRDFEGHEGWISRRLTDRTPTVIVQVPVANLRARPALTSDVTHTADRGVAFVVQRRQGPWLKVGHADGATGWIHSTLVWGRR